MYIAFSGFVTGIWFPVTCMDFGSGFCFHCSCFKSQTHLLCLFVFIACLACLERGRYDVVSSSLGVFGPGCAVDGVAWVLVVARWPGLLAQVRKLPAWAELGWPVARLVWLEPMGASRSWFLGVARTDACSRLACRRQVSQPKAHPNKLEGNQAWSFHWGKTEAKPLFHA